MRLLIIGGTGALGRALLTLAESEGHQFSMPGREELVDGGLHLATRIRSLDEISNPDAWRENDRLRADASRILVDAGGPVSEDTPVDEVLPILRSALAAEQQAERFPLAGRRGAGWHPQY